MNLSKPVPQSAKSKRAKRVLQVLGLVASLLVLAVGGWVGANLLLRQPAPKELWTEADLPALPPDNQNGWNAFADGARTLGRPSVPSQLANAAAPDLHVDAKGAWRDLERERIAIEDTVTSSPNRDWIDTIARSYAMPHFADACPIELDSNCGAMQLFRAHQLAELALLERALDGQWNEAFAGAAVLVRGDFSYVVSARVLLNQMIAFTNASRTLDVVDVLLAGYDEAGKQEDRQDADAATFAKLAGALEKLDTTGIGMQRCVKGEYIFGVRMLSILEESAGKKKLQRVWGPLDPLMYDRSATIQLLNDDFEKVMEFVDTKGAAVVTRPQFTDSTLWWVRNPIGKIVLDTGRAALLPMIEKGFKEATDLIAKRDAVLVSVKKLNGG